MTKNAINIMEEDLDTVAGGMVIIPGITVPWPWEPDYKKIMDMINNAPLGSIA